MFESSKLQFILLRDFRHNSAEKRYKAAQSQTTKYCCGALNNTIEAGLATLNQLHIKCSPLDNVLVNFSIDSRVENIPNLTHTYGPSNSLSIIDRKCVLFVCVCVHCVIWSSCVVRPDDLLHLFCSSRFHVREGHNTSHRANSVLFKVSLLNNRHHAKTFRWPWVQVMQLFIRSTSDP